MTKLDNRHITKVLGQVVDYPDQYDKSILVREPRSNNRQHLDIVDADLPFVGYDTWNAYEASTLTATGMPVTGVLKIVYPCDSTYIVESKSIKLYLNSFNMFKSGDSRDAAVANMVNVLTKDLQDLLETKVLASFITDSESTAPPVFNHSEYLSLEYDLVSPSIVEGMELTVYEETPGLLEKVSTTESVQNFRSGLLKSNCRVTSQPDWGDIYVHVLGNYHVTPESMLKYIVSFRNECHFHEEICETVYKRLNDLLAPRELCVTCLYARRGGIDINPTRANHVDCLPDMLIRSNIMHYKTQKQ